MLSRPCAIQRCQSPFPFPLPFPWPRFPGPLPGLSAGAGTADVGGAGDGEVMLGDVVGTEGVGSVAGRGDIG